MNRLENEFGEGLLVLRIDIQSQAGQELSATYASRVTPTFILFNGDGVEVWRGLGVLNADRVRQSLGH